MREASPHISKERLWWWDLKTNKAEQSLAGSQGWAMTEALECAPPWQGPLCFYPWASCMESTKLGCPLALARP